MSAGGRPQRTRLAGDRWHFQHGPIDLVIGADGDRAAIDAAIEDCWLAFDGLLDELVSELALLRAPCDPARAPRGATARTMHAAAASFVRAFGCFVTPMAAVAGAVAQTIARPLERPGIERAYVNDGGDIALVLSPGASYTVGVVSGLDPSAPGARLTVGAADGVRGIATSGWRGRSFSMGIADSVTVLARDAPQADAAATLIGNAVNVDDPAVRRAPADTLRDDTDLGSRLVTTGVGALTVGSIEQALDGGAAFARAAIDAGLCTHALIGLAGRWRSVAAPPAALVSPAAAALVSTPTAGRDPPPAVARLSGVHERAAGAVIAAGHR